MDTTRNTTDPEAMCTCEVLREIPPADAAKRIVDAIASNDREIIVAEGVEQTMGELRRTPDQLFDQVAAMVANGYMEKMQSE